MKNYLILKEGCPWESIRHLFPMVPIENKPTIAATHIQTKIEHQCYNIAVLSLTEEQTLAMARLGVHWLTDEKLPGSSTPVRVHRMALIATEWVEQVFLETPNGKLLPQISVA